MWSLPLLRKEDLGEVKKRVYKIINGEIPSNKVLENDKFYAFHDIEPVNCFMKRSIQ